MTSVHVLTWHNLLGDSGVGDDKIEVTSYSWLEGFGMVRLSL